MHDGAEVVGTDVHALGGRVLVEVVQCLRLDVLPYDAYEAIAVKPALFMEQPQRVSDLVDRVPDAAAVRELDQLSTALFADVRRTPGPTAEDDPVRLVRVLEEADAGALLPVLHGPRDSLRVR